MREEIQNSLDPAEDEALPAVQSGLIKWLWPALGSLSIGAIVVMILQSPQLSSKLGIPPLNAPENKAVVSLAPANEQAPPKAGKPAPMQPGKAAADDPTSPAKPLSDGDFQHITTRLKDQDQRIKKLEDIVGTVTGSLPKPPVGGAVSSSSVAKSDDDPARSTSSADVDTTHKSDSLNMPVPVVAVMPEKVELPPLRPAAPVDAYQDTGDAQPVINSAKPAAEKTQSKPAAGKERKTALLSKPALPEAEAEPEGRFAIRLASAGKISELKAKWKSLSKPGKDNEIAELKPKLQKAKSKKGETVYALVAGPLPDMGEAVELCVRLKLKGIACAQTDFTGDPL